MIRKLFSIVLLLLYNQNVSAWGFYAHKLINQKAIFFLPPDLRDFYLPFIPLMGKWSTAPDERRYAMKGEACRHYIDLDRWQETDSLCYLLDYNPYHMQLCLENPNLSEHGTAPWNAFQYYLKLIKAFQEKDSNKIIRLSAELGHYLADLHVPLHTTSNYNGQLSGQHGIHGLWESAIPEMLFRESWIRFHKVNFVEYPFQRIQQIMWASHYFVSKVLNEEKNLAQTPLLKWSYGKRKGQLIKKYSDQFIKSYNQALEGMVQCRMEMSVHNLADFIYSAWIEAGQPNLLTIRSK